MTLDTQNLKVLFILIITHPLIYRKKCEEDESSLTESLFSFPLETCSVQILVGNERGQRDEGTTFLSHHREPGEVVTSGKTAGPQYLSHLHFANEGATTVTSKKK